MKLQEYLTARGESYSEFGRRCEPPLPPNTIRRIALEGNPTLRNAYRIVQASREEPAPDGATVLLEDLRGPDPPHGRDSAEDAA